MYVVLIGSSGSEWDDGDWKDACVLAEPKTGHAFGTFVEAYDHADQFVEREWTIARLDTDMSKP